MNEGMTMCSPGDISCVSSIMVTTDWSSVVSHQRNNKLDFHQLITNIAWVNGKIDWFWFKFNFICGWTSCHDTGDKVENKSRLSQSDMSSSSALMSTVPDLMTSLTVIILPRPSQLSRPTAWDTRTTWQVSPTYWRTSSEYNLKGWMPAKFSQKKERNIWRKTDTSNASVKKNIVKAKIFCFDKIFLLCGP